MTTDSVDRAVGVILDNGQTIRAKYVASSVNPKLLYTRLVPSGTLPSEFLERMTRWRNGSGTFRMNVALTALPSFTALPGDGDVLDAIELIKNAERPLILAGNGVLRRHALEQPRLRQHLVHARTPPPCARLPRR